MIIIEVGKRPLKILVPIGYKLLEEK